MYKCVLIIALIMHFLFYIHSNEYQIFNKIIKLDYDLPPDLDDASKDLIRNLLVCTLVCRYFLHFHAHLFVDLRFCNQTKGLDAEKWVAMNLSDLTLSSHPQHGTHWNSSVPH